MRGGDEGSLLVEKGVCRDVVVPLRMGERVRVVMLREIGMRIMSLKIDM